MSFLCCQLFNIFETSIIFFLKFRSGIELRSREKSIPFSFDYISHCIYFFLPSTVIKIKRKYSQINNKTAMTYIILLHDCNLVRLKIGPGRCLESDITLTSIKIDGEKLDFCYPIKFVLLLFNNQ